MAKHAVVTMNVSVPCVEVLIVVGLKVDLLGVQIVILMVFVVFVAQIII